MAGLAHDDLAAYSAGSLTISDLAAKAGISKQAVSRWLRRRGLGRTSTAASGSTGRGDGGPSCAASPEPAAPGTGSAPSDPNLHPALAGFNPTDDQLRAILAGGLIAAVSRANLILAGKDSLGASSIKAVVTALANAAELLHRMGALVLDEPREDAHSRLSVARLSEVEEQEVRDLAESDAP